MARFKLFLIARPLRTTPALEAVLGEAGAPVRARVEAFIAGTAEGPILLVASDDRAAVDVHWERCNLERLAVLIVDESTLWDRLRDRLQGRAVKAPRAAPRPSPAGGDGPDAPAPLPREGLLGASSFELSKRTRVGLMAACAFAALLGLALAVAPSSDRSNGAPAQGRSAFSRNGGQGGQTRALPGAGGSGDLGAGSGGRGGAERDAAARAAGGGCAASPGGDALSSPAALLFAFVCGFAMAWGAGLVVERRGAELSHENLRAARQVAIFLAALVAASSVLLRLAALSAAREVAAPVEEPAEVPDASPGEAPEALGPFARFLRQRRGTGRRARVFRDLLDDWRARHGGGDGGADEADASLDVTLTEDDDAGAPAASADAGRHRREHRRHERHARRRHGDARDASADVAASDVASDVAADATASAGTVSAALPSGPRSAHEPVARPDEPAAAPEPARPSRRATVARAPRREPPREERTPVSPVTTFALGVAAGLALSPRWRALAKGDR